MKKQPEKTDEETARDFDKFVEGSVNWTPEKKKAFDELRDKRRSKK